jgi:hypothetical protein
VSAPHTRTQKQSWHYFWLLVNGAGLSTRVWQEGKLCLEVCLPPASVFVRLSVMVGAFLAGWRRDCQATSVSYRAQNHWFVKTVVFYASVYNFTISPTTSRPGPGIFLDVSGRTRFFRPGFPVPRWKCAPRFFPRTRGGLTGKVDGDRGFASQWTSLSSKFKTKKAFLCAEWYRSLYDCRSTRPSLVFFRPSKFDIVEESLWKKGRTSTDDVRNSA